MAGSKAGQKRENTGDWKESFLAFYSRFPNVMRAARHAGVSRAMVYKEAAGNPEFKAQFEEAKAEGIETIEGVAMELASKNRDARHNTLRIFMLKAHKREIYGDQSEIRLKGSADEPVRVDVTAKLQPLSDDDLEALERLIDKLEGSLVSGPALLTDPS